MKFTTSASIMMFQIVLSFGIQMKAYIQFLVNLILHVPIVIAVYNFLYFQKRSVLHWSCKSQWIKHQ